MRGSFYAESTRRQRFSLPAHLFSARHGSLFAVIVVCIFDLFFDCHVAEFGGVEDLAAGLALDKLGVLVSGDDLNDGVFALGGHRWGDLVGMVWILPAYVLLVNPLVGLSIDESQVTRSRYPLAASPNQSYTE